MTPLRYCAVRYHHKRPNGGVSPKVTLILSSVAIFLFISTTTLAQSIKGGGNQPGQRLQPTTTSTNSYSPTAQSPVTQLRQQQQGYQRPSQTTTPAAPTKRRLQQQQPIQQQQLAATPVVETYREQQQREDRFPVQQQQQPAAAVATTEDPLADSEPALYGSVAGSPGVDFPAYTQIPKTSFSCEGKGFDFGFYADEEAQCQVYHVCWSGRRESFLCGVGTVFNQAILACDYWHSVDCSKSSQFYSVNSELGKAGAEPAAGGANAGRQQQRQRTISPANLPARSGFNQNQYDDQQQPQQQQISVLGPSSGFGEQLSQRRITQQQQQTYPNEDSLLDGAQQPVRTTTPSYSSGTSTSTSSGFIPQRNIQQQQQSTGGQYEQTQQRVETANLGLKSPSRVQQPGVATTTLSTPPAVKRPRFNMDFNQKVNSLIESPVRPPLGKSSPAAKRPATTLSSAAPPPVATKSAPTTTRKPIQQQQISASFAQMAVARAQQKSVANQTPARKGVTQKQPQFIQQRLEQQQQQQQFDSDADEPQQQLQQQNFDDSPVQTSTAPAIAQQQIYSGQSRQTGFSSGANPQANNFMQQQMVIQSGGNAPDGSSAITTQYDTMTPVGQGIQQQQQQQQQQAGDSGQDSSYESALDDSSSANDDFRSSGAKAAASHNQNWYIMRTI